MRLRAVGSNGKQYKLSWDVEDGNCVLVTLGGVRNSRSDIGNFYPVSNPNCHLFDYH